MAITIIHLSDLHVTVDRDHQKKDTPEIAGFKKITKTIIKKHGINSKSTYILITGDLTANGRKDESEKVAELLQDLYDKGFTVWTIPGNHEYGPGGWWNFWRIWIFYIKIINKNPDFVLGYNYFYPQLDRLNGLYFLGLNSMKRIFSIIPWFARGYIGTRQIFVIKNKLTKINNLKKYNNHIKTILFLHHHPFDFPKINTFEKDIQDRWDKAILALKDNKLFMKSIKGKVDILLFGHKHFHVDFSDYDLCKEYGFARVLSCGRSTDDKSKEYKVEKEGTLASLTRPQKGLLGWKIEIDDKGLIKTSAIKF